MFLTNHVIAIFSSKNPSVNISNGCTKARSCKYVYNLLNHSPLMGVQFSSFQFSHSVVSESLPPHESQHSLSITISRSSCKLTSIESVMLSSHLILCRPLLLLPPIPPSISLFQWVMSSHEVAKVLEFHFTNISKLSSHNAQAKI